MEPYRFYREAVNSWKAGLVGRVCGSSALVTPAFLPLHMKLLGLPLNGFLCHDLQKFILGDGILGLLYSKVSQTGCLNQGKLIVSQFWRPKSQIKVSAWLVPSEGCDRRIWSRPFPLAGTWLSCPCTFTSPLFLYVPRVPLIRAQIGLGPSLMTSLI